MSDAESDVIMDEVYEFEDLIGKTPTRPTWRMEPHIKGWEAKLAADETRLRASMKPRKAKLN